MPATRPITMDSLSVEERSVAAYLGLAIGDALGATVEFLTVREIVSRYRQHKDILGGGWLNLKAGQVTDDTTMSLSLGDCILSCLKIDAVNIAEGFSDWMRAKPVDIGNTVRRGIVNFRYSGTPIVPESEHDAGNGACMRCLPIALSTYGENIDFVVAASQVQAHITHNNQQSDAGTETIIHCLQEMLSGADKQDLLDGPVSNLVGNYPEFDFNTKKSITNPSGYIVETLIAVFQAFFNNETFEDCLIDVVNRGGDADTTGAITGMLAGAYYGEAQIPPRWVKKMNKSVLEKCRDQAMMLITNTRTISKNTSSEK